MTKLLVASILLLCAATAYADETYVPATPIAPVQDVIAGYKVVEFDMTTPIDGSTAHIFVMVQPIKADGTCARDALQACRQVQATYDGSAAEQMVNALNTANLTTNSLRKRIVNKLVQDGYIPAGGNVTGTPGLPVLPTPAPTVLGP